MLRLELSFRVRVSDHIAELQSTHANIAGENSLCEDRRYGRVNVKIRARF